MGKRAKSTDHEIAECDMWLSTINKKPKTSNVKLSAISWPLKKPAAFVKQTTLLNYFSNNMKCDGTSEGSSNPEGQRNLAYLDSTSNSGQVVEGIHHRGVFYEEYVSKQELYNSTADHRTGRSEPAFQSSTFETAVENIHSVSPAHVSDRRIHGETEDDVPFPSPVQGTCVDVRVLLNQHRVDLHGTTGIETHVEDTMRETLGDGNVLVKDSMELPDETAALDSCVPNTLVHYRKGESSPIDASFANILCGRGRVEALSSTCCVISDSLEEASCYSFPEPNKTDVVIPDSLVEATCPPENGTCQGMESSHLHHQGREALCVGGAARSNYSASSLVSQSSYTLDSVDSLTDNVRLNYTEKLDLFEMELELMRQCPSGDHVLSEQTLLPS